ncbi:hypothetical protein BKA67DRAFT_533853 [Truncatella angustata]|uniref:Uncharacterized protein n=1 Tax=Truncatella angustata TaxID=152316 RepID=A0A9P8UTA5_9PEZI|nr:uncharacterized protein BKA67DRAFT_533853 [Truncatella angustata]KAH6658735.1 hypothetical protein BKA67DRAFT_533853 [Truncatella angustata]KAH8203491.1 hypothetical protein TruAng_002362 [Truncatella angustata]
MKSFSLLALSLLAAAAVVHADLCIQGWNSPDCTGTQTVSICASQLVIGQCGRVGTNGPFRSVRITGESNKYNINLWDGDFQCNGALDDRAAIKTPISGCKDTRANYDSWMRVA